MLTIQQVAKLIGRSVGSVRNYCRAEDLPFERDRRTGRLVFDEDQVREWLSRPETRDFMKWGDRTLEGRAKAHAGPQTAA